MENDCWNLLLVDDDEDDYILVREWLDTAKPGEFSLTWTSQYETALEKLEANAYDAVLIDYDLGGFNGLDLTNEIVQRNYNCPTIMLTGRGGYQVDVGAMRAGAAEYLNKTETTPRLLERAIRYAIEHRKNLEELRRANEELAAARDDLEQRVRERTEELHDQNARLQYQAYLLENVSDAIYAVGTDQKFTAWNRAAERIYGWKAEEVLGVESHQVLNSEPLEASRESHIQRLVESGMVTGEYVQARKDGRSIIVENTGIILKNSEDQVSGYVGVSRDITERKAQEAQIRRYTRRVEALAQISHDLAELGRDMNAVLDTVCRRVVEWIGDTCTVTVLSQDGTRLEEHYVYYPIPEAQEAHRQAMADSTYRVGEGIAGRVAETGEPVIIPVIDLEQALQRVHPAYKSIMQRFPSYSLLIVPMKIHNQVVGTLGISRLSPDKPYTEDDQEFLQDIADRTSLAVENARLFSMAQQELAERRRIEGELRESRALFERLFESAPDPILLLDADGRIRQVNHQTLHVFGRSTSELAGQPFTILLPQNYHAMFADFMMATSPNRRTATGSRPLRMEKDIAALRRDGTEFPIELVQAPFRLDSTSGYICVIHDITRRKAMEAGLAEVPRRLLEGVEAERLRLAKELHDGPIQEMYGVAFGLRSISGEMGPEDFSAIMRIEEMLKRLYDTIQTMRDISRFLRPPTLSPFGLEKTIRSHVENFREQHPGLDIRMELQPDAQELSESVRLVLFRVLQNALSNIVRHASATEVTVRFALDAGATRLEVQDNGSGFEFNSNFVDFVRGGHLGLAGSNERVEAIGGRMEVITAPGQGTLVRVVAPLRVKAAEPGPV